MATYSVTNGPATVTGAAGSDTLIVTWNVDGGVDTQGFVGDLANGYSGWFDGPGSANIDFSGIEHFNFTDLGEGADSIVTGDGDDTLNGGLGNDRLNSGGGIDDVNGGDGDDTWIADKSAAATAISIDLTGGVQAYLGSGSVQNIEAMQLKTGSGNDTLQGTTAQLSDMIESGAGNDLIILPLAYQDTVDGGAGTDTLVVVNSNDAGVDTQSFSGTLATGYSGWLDGVGSNNVDFSGIERFSITDNGDGPDRIVTGAGDDTLNGGAGDDDLDSGSGRDVIDGGAGNDIWRGNTAFSNAAIIIDLSKAAPQLFLGTGSVVHVEAMRLTTGGGADRLTGTSALLSDVINSGAGADIITLPLAAYDTVNAGGGEDTLVVVCSVDGGVDTQGFAGNANGYSGWYDGPGSNNIDFTGVEKFSFTDTGVGANHIRTGLYADTVSTGAGDDFIDSGKGADVINGGAGTDYWTADRSAVTADIVIDLNLTTKQNIGGGGSIRAIEGMSLVSGSGDDRIATSNAAVADYVFGGGGDDLLTIRLHGTDTVNGGNGRDRLVVDYLGNDVDLTISRTAKGYVGDFNGPGSDNIFFSRIEDFSLTLSSGADTLGGFVGHDMLDGQGGADSLSGGDGRDTLLGGSGNDTLDGGADQDCLVGGTGVDRIVGGLGKDVMTGGGDADRFVFTSLADSVKGAQADLITDFGGNDRIDLSGIDANTATGGDQAFTFIGGGGFSGTAGELRAAVSGGSTYVSGDVDGDGAADFQIQLSGELTLGAGAFVL